jgi:hypothetical protein
LHRQPFQRFIVEQPCADLSLVFGGADRHRTTVLPPAKQLSLLVVVGVRCGFAGQAGVTMAIQRVAQFL